MDDKPKLYIRAVHIDGLFGRHDQQLTLTDVRLGILYGFNGSGKTTILRLAESLLTQSITRLKKRVFRLAFRSFTLEFSDGSAIGFRRAKGANVGAFDYFIESSSNSIVIPFPEHFENADSRGADDLFGRTNEDSSNHNEFKHIIRKQFPNLVVLTADRNTDANITPDRIPIALRPQTVRNLGLQDSIERFVLRLQLRARRESNTADYLAFDVFSNMVRGVALGEQSPEADISTLLRTLQAQIKRIDTYSEIGLTTTVDADALVKTLSRVSDQRVDVVRELLAPYLQSQEAKLGSLDRIYQVVTRFVASINRFYHDKRITLDLLRGLMIHGLGGEQLQAGVLSSGERQLLLLFTRCTALEQPSTIVLLDEPELSLNSEWTRILLRHLLHPELTGNAQFLIATHSIEMLAQYESAVLELKGI